MKKRIVFLRSNPVNPDPRVEKEANCLLGGGYEVYILAWDRSSMQKNAKSCLKMECGVAKVIRLGIPASFGEGMKNLRPFLIFQSRLFWWLLRNHKSYDVIHACDFDTAFVAYCTTRITKKKLIFDIFDFLCTNTGDKPNWLEKSIVYWQHKIIAHADATILCTEHRVKQIKGAHPRKLCIIHNSPVLQRVCPNLHGACNQTLKIVYVGILQDYRFLKELAEIVADNSRYELHIGGFGKYEEHFSRLAQKCPNIFYYGKLPYAETLELEKSCDIITALYDPSVGNHVYAAPNKFYEALMLGKPLIMVRGTGMSEVVEEQGLGEVIDYTKESLLEGLRKIEMKRPYWEEISMRMRELYEEKYSWKEMEHRLLKLYGQI